MAPTRAELSLRTCSGLLIVPQMKVDDLHPCPSPVDDAPVSVFLDSFSAFGTATAGAVQTVEVTSGSQSTSQEHAPDKLTLRAEVTATTEAAYELSEPLAQVRHHCWDKVSVF